MRAIQQVLPEAMPGHETFHPYPHDMKKARELIAAADPSERKVTVWTNDYGPNKEAGEYYEGVLRELGFEPTLKVMRRGELHDDHRQRIDPEPRHRLGQLVPRLPAPERLLRAAALRQGIAADRRAPTTRASPTRRSTARSRSSNRETLGPETGSRLRAARPRGDEAGALGPLRLADPEHLRLQRDRPRKARGQPGLRPGPGELRTAVGGGGAPEDGKGTRPSRRRPWQAVAAAEMAEVTGTAEGPGERRESSSRKPHGGSDSVTKRSGTSPRRARGVTNSTIPSHRPMRGRPWYRMG